MFCIVEIRLHATRSGTPLLIQPPRFSFYRQAQVLSHQGRAAVPRWLQEVHEIRGLLFRAVPFLASLQPYPLHTTTLQLRSPLCRSTLLPQTEARAARVRVGLQKVQAGERRWRRSSTRIMASGRHQHSKSLPKSKRGELERRQRLAVLLLPRRFVSKRQRPSHGSHRANHHSHCQWKLHDHRRPTSAAAPTATSAAHCHGTGIPGTCHL